MEKQEETSSKKKWGIGMVVTPIMAWFLVAMANGFDFSHSWLGSSGTDLFVGVIGAVVIIIGIILLRFNELFGNS